MNTFREIKVWQKAVDFVTKFYKETRNFPQEELYGLISQMRRSAVSIPSNIAEGFGRKFHLNSNDFYKYQWDHYSNYKHNLKYRRTSIS